MIFAQEIGLPFRRGTKAEHNADFVLDGRVAVFLDGDFWHGRSIKDSLPESWKAKLEANARRDAINRSRLKSDGWCVLSCWESDFLRKPAAFLEEVRCAVASRTLTDGR